MSEGPNALRNRDGYVIIGDQAYGKNEAQEVARKDLDYFQKNDKHLPPLPYPTTPDLRPEFYPDVTKQINSDIDKMAAMVATMKPVDRIAIMEKNFPNNEKWDLQVERGLPGQVAEYDIRTGEVAVDSSGKVMTKDQYANFNGEIHRAGYISNSGTCGNSLKLGA